jgi:hypothetical protein
LNAQSLFLRKRKGRHTENGGSFAESPFQEAEIIEPINEVVRRFDAVLWHDSKLTGLRFYSTESEERVEVSVELRQEHGSLAPSVVIFMDCVYAETEMYLAAKRVCSDDIASGTCYVSSQWIKSVAEKYPHDTFDGYLHFRIHLIEPGGMLNVLAKDFSILRHASE